MNKALSIGSASLRHFGGTMKRRNGREAKAMIRAILTIGVTVGCSIVASAAGCAMESAAGGRPFETQGLRVVARQPGPALLELDFRVSPPVEVTAATMLVNGRVLPASYIFPYPSPGDLSAVLFLVDTSDPARERVVERNLRDIKALMDKGAAHHRFGLAGFARELSVLAPLGTAPTDIMAAARSPRTKGRIAQIYPSAIQAIDVLMAYPASRRALVIFSDGSAEDPEHSLEEVIERANAAGVVIYGLGYARKVGRSPGFQSLRLMASATDGAYAEAVGRADLPKTFLADPFRVLDNGGRAIFDLSALGPASRSRTEGRPGPGDGTVVARVVFHTAEGDKVIDILVTLPPAYWVEAPRHPEWDVLIDVLVTFPRGDSDGVLRPRKKPCRAHKARHKAAERKSKCRAARRDRREADEERTQRKAERKAAEAEEKPEARRRVKHKAAEARAQRKAERKARRKARPEADKEGAQHEAERKTERKTERKARREARREADEEEEEKRNADRRRRK